VIIGSSPVVTALLSALLIHDVPLRALWAGGLLSFAGVGLSRWRGSRLRAISRCSAACWSFSAW